jgi:hypothetical protein
VQMIAGANLPLSRWKFATRKLILMTLCVESCRGVPRGE